MKIIRPANKSSKFTLIEVDDNELHLFEMQRNRKVLNTVKKSMELLQELNFQTVEGMKAAVSYYNAAYKHKIETTMKDIKIGRPKKC